MTARTLLASDRSSSPLSVPELAELTESTTSFELSPLSPVEGEPLRHILLGSPGGVRQTIQSAAHAALRRKCAVEPACAHPK